MKSVRRHGTGAWIQRKTSYLRMSQPCTLSHASLQGVFPVSTLASCCLMQHTCRQSTHFVSMASSPFPTMHAPRSCKKSKLADILSAMQDHRLFCVAIVSHNRQGQNLHDAPLCCVTAVTTPKLWTGWWKLTLHPWSKTQMIVVEGVGQACTRRSGGRVLLASASPDTNTA